jgi:hypothetical protein
MRNLVCAKKSTHTTISIPQIACVSKISGRALACWDCVYKTTAGVSRGPQFQARPTPKAHLAENCPAEKLTPGSFTGRLKFAGAIQ